jgi:hypothetical protein
MAQRGGGRPGAGRKKGSANKSTLAHKARLAESGLSPLDYMLSVLRSETETAERRMDAAKAAAPYVHPRLAAIEHGGKDGGPIQFQRIERVVIDPAD